MDRWQTAVRLQWTNRLLADVYASPRAGDVTALLLSADAHAGDAAALLAAWELRGASVAARAAYADVVAAMDALRLRAEPWSARADQGATGLAAWAQDPVLDPGLRTEAALVSPASPPTIETSPQSHGEAPSATDRREPPHLGSREPIPGVGPPPWRD